MDTLFGMVLIGGPLSALGILLALASGRERRRLAAAERQIALTDAIHARLGAAVAPVVRRRRGDWQVTIAVPLERPPVVASVLAIVDEVFAQPGSAPYEVVLQRQSVSESRAHPPRRASVGRESLSWT
jgi:hypothetical protein